MRSATSSSNKTTQLNLQNEQLLLISQDKVIKLFAVSACWKQTAALSKFKQKSLCKNNKT